MLIDTDNFYYKEGKSCRRLISNVLIFDGNLINMKGLYTLTVDITKILNSVNKYYNDGLVEYYDFNRLFFKTENDMTLWKLKYNV